jgi:hypothetical protein
MQVFPSGGNVALYSLDAETTIFHVLTKQTFFPLNPFGFWGFLGFELEVFYITKHSSANNNYSFV